MCIGEGDREECLLPCRCSWWSDIREAPDLHQIHCHGEKRQGSSLPAHGCANLQRRGEPLSSQVSFHLLPRTLWKHRSFVLIFLKRAWVQFHSAQGGSPS